MKKAYLIYENKEAQKNHGFIEMFQQAGKEKGIDFSFVSKTDYQTFSEKINPDFVLNRTRDPGVSRWYETRNIPVYHNSRLVELANHKYKMMTYFQEHLPEKILNEKWCPATVFLTVPAQMGDISNTENAEIMKYAADHIGTVIPEQMRHGVIKSVSGHGGSEVFLVEAQEEWRDILAGREVVVQEKIECHSRDLRVYVLAGEIYCAMLREGKKDFRSNFSLGGSVREMGLTPAQREYIDCFIKCLPDYFDGMYSIDFLPLPDGRLIFDEVEEMVGCRMLYQYTEHDIVKDYVTYLFGKW